MAEAGGLSYKQQVLFPGSYSLCSLWSLFKPHGSLMERALSLLAGRETEILRVLHSQTLWLVETRTEPHSVGLTSCLHTVKPLNQQVMIRPQFFPPQHGDNFFLWFLAIWDPKEFSTFPSDEVWAKNLERCRDIHDMPEESHSRASQGLRPLPSSSTQSAPHDLGLCREVMVEGGPRPCLREGVEGAVPVKS